MRLSVEIDSTTIDILVTGADGEENIAGLLDALGVDGSAEFYAIDGNRHHRNDALSSIAICDGSLLTTWADRPSGIATISRLAGPGTGHTVTLAPGAYDIGTAGIGGLADPQFRVVVHPDGDTSVTPLGTADVHVDGVPITAPTPGAVITTSDAAYRLATVDRRPQRSPGRRHAGRVAFARPPRLIAATHEETIDGPEVPKGATEPQPLSWILMLAPIPLGIIMAKLFSPFFLIFTLMSPITTLARWWDSKRRQRKDGVRIERETRERLVAFAERIRDASVAEALRRRAKFWCLPGLRQISAAGEAGLWEVRPHHDDFLEVHIGLGGVRWMPHIARHGDLVGLDDVVLANTVLPSAPVSVSLPEVRGLGIVGHPDAARRLAAGIVVELAARQGPADIDLHGLFDPSTVAAWDWVKWLPHFYDDAGRVRLALDVQQARDLLAGQPTAPGRRPAVDDSGRTSVLIIDGQDHLDGRVPEVAARVNRDAAVAIVVADRPEHLPAICTAVVSVDANSRATLTDMVGGTVTPDVTAAVADPATVVATARSLARFIDPEAHDDAGLLPERCLLTDLLPRASDVDGIGRTWRDPPPGLVATLGVCADGPMQVDLVRDGPHALVAGTTGAGKSELLRTLVAGLAGTYSPESVNFVLVDFKGGGAFDSCAELPHTVGVVTDLDEHLAGRALRCLKAELKHRERRLRSAGVSDLGDLPGHESPLPRLVIVVDEFATLAAELPEFMTSLVDVAQRGRSLGIHMVLATQRPSGVIDAKIKANTNLRIALRVQDDNDSLDVVGSAVAATVHRNQPGRAFARLGASELTPFQTAIVSEVSPPATTSQIRIEPFELLRPEQTTEIAPLDGPEDLRIITDATTAVASDLGLEPARVPWPPPLPDEVDLRELRHCDEDRWSMPIGLVDLPDEQRRDVAIWRSAQDGNILVYGVDTAATSGALATMCAAVAGRHSPAEAHMYVVDFAGSLSTLADLPHVGAYLGPEDDERINRLLDLLDTELESRRAIQRESRKAVLGPDDAPMLLIAVANYAALLEHFDECGEMDAPGRLAAVVRDGPSLGMFVCASANHERGIPMKVAGLVPAKYIMRMADPMSYTSFGLRSKDVPDLGPGRAIDVRSGLEMQFASCAHPADIARQTSDRSITDNVTGPAVLKTLGTRIELGTLDGRSTLDGDLWRVVIGTEHQELTTASLDLRPNMPAIVAGSPASGRTTTLATVCASVSGQEQELSVATIGFVAGQPTLTEAADVEAFWPTGDLLLVDDIELLTPAMTSALEQLVAASGPAPRLVVSGRTETFKTMQPLVRALTVARTGLLLRPQPDAGEVFRTRIPGTGLYPPGRGHLFNGGLSSVVQVAMAPRSVGPQLPEPKKVSAHANRMPS